MTALVGRLRGWPEEGYLDLSQPRWWNDRVLALRPRELHLVLPFKGHRRAMPVFDQRVLDAATPVDLARICIPPAKRGLWSTDWRARYVFEFQLPVAERSHARRNDDQPSPEAIEWQFQVHWAVAAHLHEAGLSVYVRDALDAPPQQFCELGAWLAPGSLAHLAC
jgi:hypothetical protein